MADNTVLNAGAGGDTIASDDIAGVKHQRVKIEFGADGSATDVSAAAPLPVDSELTTADLDTGAGTDTRAVVGLVLAASGGGLLVGSANPVPVSDNGGALTVDGSVSLAAALPAGTNNIGDVDVLSLPAIPAGANAIGTVGVTSLPALPAGANNIGDVDVLTLPALPAGTNNIGDVDVLTLPAIPAGANTIGGVSLVPRTSGGLTMSKTVSAASTNATSVKASAGQVYGVQVMNLNAAARYLKLYNKASAPTVGTDTPVKTLLIPGNTAGAGVVLSWANGLAFGTGIAFALTTGIADSDTGAVAANELVVNLDYA